MSRIRVLLVLALLAMVGMASPSSVIADHCGADATISPQAGPPGTTFVFTTDLGAPSDLRLFRDERPIKTVFLAGDGFVTFQIVTGRNDSGRWRARAEVRGSPDCVAEAFFVVLEAPDTSTSPSAGRLLAGALIVGAGILAFTLALVRQVHRRRA